MHTIEADTLDRLLDAGAELAQAISDLDDHLSDPLMPIVESWETAYRDIHAEMSIDDLERHAAGAREVA